MCDDTFPRLHFGSQPMRTADLNKFIMMNCFTLMIHHPTLCFVLAEKFLESVEGNQNYPILLLTLLEKSQDNVIRVCAAVTFKNYIKRNWRIVSVQPLDQCSSPVREGDEAGIA